MAEKQKIERYRVLEIPSTELISGQNYELYLGGGVYRNYIVNDSLQLVAQDGKEFIECDTVDDLRALDSRQIWAIQNGYYKGVKLNGYYQKGDTPTPIEYYLSDTEEEDDGKYVIEIGNIKLKHDTVGTLPANMFSSSPAIITRYKKTSEINKDIALAKETGRSLVSLLPGKDYEVDEEILLSPDVKLEGNSAFSTRIITNEDLPVIVEGSSQHYGYDVRNFLIQGIAGSNVLTNPTIDVGTVPVDFPDTYHVFENIVVRYGGGFRFRGRGCIHANNLKALFPRRQGFEILSPDSYFSDLHSINSWGHGIDIKASNNRLIGCLSAYSGRDKQDGEIAGYNIQNAQRLSLIGCQSQDSAGHGFLVKAGSFDVSILGAVSDNNGVFRAVSKGGADDGCGYFIQGASDIEISGSVDNTFRDANHGGERMQKYALGLSGTPERLNINIVGRNQGISSVNDRLLASTSHRSNISVKTGLGAGQASYMNTLLPANNPLHVSLTSDKGDFDTALSITRGSEANKFKVLLNGTIRWGTGSSVEAGLFSPVAKTLSPENGTTFQIRFATYQTPFKIGVVSLWQDANNNIRIKSTTPTSDTDGTIIQTASSFSTANRPSLTSIPTGYCVFDTTLGKPIWKKSNTEWVDATGTVV